MRGSVVTMVNVSFVSDLSLLRQRSQRPASAFAHRAYFKSLYIDRLEDLAIDEIAPRCADRPSNRSLCSVWYMGAAVGRVPKEATAFGDRSFRWVLSIDAIWDKPEDDALNLS